MTRLLMVSLNYAPELTGISPYATGVAEHLASRGYDVSVVAGMPHYPEWRARTAPSRERRNGVDVRRVKHYVPRSQSMLRRGLYEASSLSMARAASQVAPDVVLGIVPSLSSGVVARSIAARHGVPYGIIVQDLMAPAATQSGLTSATVAQRAIGATERWVLRGAQSVGIVAEGFRPYVESMGVDPARIGRLRNWSRDLPATVVRKDMRLLLGWARDAIVCLHAGNMGQKQGLENVVECARLAANIDPRLLFVLMGDGNQSRPLAALVERYALPTLRILPPQPDDVYASALQAADILLLNQRGSVREMSLPSKLTSYFAAGRPVVAAAAADSEAARELADSGAGVIASPDDPAALLEAIRNVAGHPDLSMRLGQHGRRWAREVLSAEAALRGYEAFIEKLLQPRTRRAAPVASGPTRTDETIGERRAA